MKKVLHIYAMDWRRISRSKAAMFLIVALMFLPSLYAWFNIKALWDPYGNTSGIHIAVANDDEGTTLEGKQLNVGAELIKKLQNNTSLGWTFVSKEKADKGVTNGDYYASIYISKSFSKDLASIVGDHPTKAEIVFTVNDKINAITPKITATGANTITTQVSQEFVNSVSKSLLTAFDKIGIELNKDLPTIRKIESKLYQIHESLPEITAFGQEMIELEKQLPMLQEKANKIIRISNYIPQINVAGDSILKIQSTLPVIDQVGQRVLLLQSKIPEIRNMTEKVNGFNEHFDVVKKTLNEGLVEANQALDIINATQQLYPKIEELAGNSQNYVGVATNFTDSLRSSFDEITDTIRLNLVLINQVSNNVAIITDQIMNSDIQPNQVLTYFQTIETLFEKQLVLVDNQVTHLQSLIEQGIAVDRLSDLQQRLLNVKQRIQNQQSIVRNTIKYIQNNGEQLPDTLQTIQNESSAVQQSTEDVLEKYDSTYLPAVKVGLEDLKKDIETANDIVVEAQKQLPNVKSLLGDTEQTLQTASMMLKSYQDELPRLEQSLQSATDYINGNIDQMIDKINFVADFYKKDFNSMKDQVNRGSAFVTNDLPALEKEIQHGTQLLKEKIPKLVEAVQIASDLSRTELPQFTKTIDSATNRLEETKEKISIEEVIHLLRTDIKVDSDFMAHPVQLKEVREFPVANYGSASSPFYTALAIWVGALLLVSMLSVDVHMPKEMYQPHHFYFGRGLTFLTISLIQTAIIALGNIYILGVDVAMKVPFIFFSLLISFVFVTIVYTCVSIFGNLGKGLAIIMLVLQISSSGGNFPIEVSSPFFQHIYPFLPFTYAVKLLREGVGGVLWHNASIYMMILIGIAVVFIILGTLLKKPLMKLVRRFSENAKKSMMFH